MGRVGLIEHGIVLQDLSGLGKREESLAAIAEAIRFMETQPRGEALVLTDVTGATFDQEVVEAIRGLIAHHKSWVRASAVIGLTPLMRIVFRAVVAVTRRDIRACSSRADAVGYLLSCRVSAPSTKEPASPRTPADPRDGPR